MSSEYWIYIYKVPKNTTTNENPEIALCLLDVKIGNCLLKHSPFQLYMVIIWQWRVYSLLHCPQVVDLNARMSARNSVLSTVVFRARPRHLF